LCSSFVLLFFLWFCLLTNRFIDLFIFYSFVQGFFFSLIEFCLFAWFRITSVGATMLVKSSSDKTISLQPRSDKPPICNKWKCATVTTEGVCTYPGALITTGGGFSDYSPVPSWQASATTTYLKSEVKLPDSKYFNASNR
jgi:hypothetical protein